ncbi:MAG TPA: response regulator [Chitinophagaceae bacterium]|jgi:CheY-like chemotaxis protein|nr:response regulator [Chitinophagaceae bacterium]
MTKSTTPKNIVLYADDDEDDLELVKDAFQQYTQNVEVVTVTDGSQALSFLDRLSEFDPTPCLIILDINMPVLNGKETLVRLRELPRYESVPVVLFTTSAMPVDRTFAGRYNAGFITKPIGIRQMERIADEFIDHCAEEIRHNIRTRKDEL